MRCLYCGIKLKIAATAKLLQHCPECSVRIEYENVRKALPRAEDRNRNARAVNGLRHAAPPKSA